MSENSSILSDEQKKFVDNLSDLEEAWLSRLYAVNVEDAWLHSVQDFRALIWLVHYGLASTLVVQDSKHERMTWMITLDGKVAYRRRKLS